MAMILDSELEIRDSDEDEDEGRPPVGETEEEEEEEEEVGGASRWIDGVVEYITIWVFFGVGNGPDKKQNGLVC
jgi:hypothetical protein